MQEEIRAFIFSELLFVDDPAGFGDEDDLLDVGLDSMGIMRLVLFVEERFGITLPDDELEPENLRTLGRLQRWIERHR